MKLVLLIAVFFANSWFGYNVGMKRTEANVLNDCRKNHLVQASGAVIECEVLIDSE